MPLGVVTIPIGSTSAKMAKLPTLTLVVVCEPLGPIYITPMSYRVHWSMRPACTGGLNILHREQQKWKIAPNGQKCAHSWLGQMRHMPDLDRSVPQDWYQVICVQHIFSASPNASGFGNGRVAK